MRNLICRSFFCWLLVSGLPFVPAVAEDNHPKSNATLDALDAIPANATAAVAIRSISELTTRGDEFIDKTKVQVPVRLSMVVSLLWSFIDVNEGIDRNGNLALMVFSNQPDGSDLVLAVQIKDIGQLANSMRIPRDKLVPNPVLDRRDYPGNNNNVPFVAVRGSHLYVSLEREVMEFAMGAPPLSGFVSKEIKKTLGDDDILLYAAKSQFSSSPFKSVTETLADLFAKDEDAQTKLACLDELNRAIIGIRLDEGVGVTAMFDFAGQQSRDLLSRVASDNTSATLDGLPAGQLLVAQSVSTRGDEMAQVTQSLFGLLLDRIVIESDDMLSSSRRSKIANLFGLSWQSCEQTRVGLYENRDPAKDGWFSLVAILDAEEPEQFVQDMVDLAPFMHASGLTVAEAKETLGAAEIEGLVEDLGNKSFRRRRLAALKLNMVGTPALPSLKKAYESSDFEVRSRARSIVLEINRSLASERKSLLEKDLLARLKPQLAFVAKQETRAGRSVDFVRLGLRGNSDAIVTRLKRLLGSQWNTIRVAVVGNQVILLVGSDLSLFESALEIAQTPAAERKEIDRFAAFEQRAAVNRCGELHLSLARLEQLVDEKVDPLDRPDKATTTSSFNVLVSPQRIRLDLFAPFEEVRVVTEKMGL